MQAHGGAFFLKKLGPIGTNFARYKMTARRGINLRRAVRQEKMNVSPPNRTQPTGRVNVYEVRPATTGDGFDLISEAISSGRLRLSKQHVAIGYATLHSGSHASVIRVYDAAGQLVATHEQQAGRSAARE